VLIDATNPFREYSFNEGPAKDGGRRSIFVSGDHLEPVEFVKEPIASFGFSPIHLGGLVVGGPLQQAGAPSPAAILSISAATD
jgi:8-hydroxy-5-deazaflavin:NADPH oxidoreductase